MKNKKRYSLIAIFMVAAGFTAAAIVYKTQRVGAFNPQPDPPGFGMVGLTQGQSIRINVVNTAPAPDPNAPPDPCRVVLTFRDVNGQLFHNDAGNVVRRIVQLQGGESAALALNADDFARMFDGNGRLQLRPVVQIQQADGTNGAPPDPCLPSAEVVNNANARTQFMLPFVPTNLTPQNHNETFVRDPNLR